VPADVASKVSSDTQARTLTTAYDLLGRKRTVTGQSSSNFYAGSTATTSNATTISQPNGGAPPPKTTYDFNVFGEVVRESQQITATTTRDTWHYYDLMGREKLTVDPGRYQTVRTYDALGNLKTIVESAQPGALGSLTTPPALLGHDPDDRITILGYDARDQQTSVQRGNFRFTNAQGQDVDNGYDAATTVSTTEYDALGRAMTQTDALGNRTVIEYNALGQVTKVTEPARTIAVPQVAIPSQPNSTPTAIDPFRTNKTATPVTSYEVDAFGQVVGQSRIAIDTNGGATIGSAITSSRSYDVAGNTTSTTDGNGNVTSYRMDYAGRVIAQSQNVNVTLGNWGTVTQTVQRRFVYDAVGRQTDVLDVYKDGSGTLQQAGTHREYNAFGEVKEEYREWGAESAAPATLTRAIVAAYRYDMNGQRIAQTAGDGITKYYYDLAGQLTRQEQYSLALNADGTAQINQDGTANIDTAVAARITETGYDALGRPSIVRLPSFSAMPAGSSTHVLITPILQQTYDRWGNVLTRSQGGYALNSNGTFVPTEVRTCQYRYNANNQLIAEREPVVLAKRADGSTYSVAVTHESHYDLGGRLIVERDVADDAGTSQIEANLLRTRRHEYDAIGELTADVDATNVRTEYAYDANGNRVGTRNVGNGTAGDAIVNTVFVDGFDANGNLTSHSILRANNGSASYVSGSSQTPVLFVLKVFQYDQANRRVASGDVMHDPSHVFWTYTKYDERGLVREQRTPHHVFQQGVGEVDVGIVTRSQYDQFGNKISQLDANNQGQTWFYSGDAPSLSSDPADQTTSYLTDYSVGQLRHTTAGTRTTKYGYGGFAQVLSETYTDSSGALTAGQMNSRTYSYFDNGLLREVADTSSVGTIGETGGDDYWKTVNTSDYEYSVNGEQTRAAFTVTSEQDFGYYDDAGNLIAVNPTPTVNAPISRLTTATYDALGRLATVTAPAAQNANHSAISSLTYYYDELGNRREIDAVYQRVGDANASGSQKWYAYDAEGRMTIVDGQLTNGVINANLAGATEVTYDALGRRSTTTKYVGADSSDNHAPSSEFREIADWTEFNSQKYTYNDLGFLTKTWQAITRRDSTVTLLPPFGGLGTTTHPADHTGTWFLLEDRVVDVRGAMTFQTLYSAVTASPTDYDDDFAPYKASDLNVSYLADGRLNSQLTQQFNAQGSTTQLSYLVNTYDGAGILDYYTYQQGTSLATPDFTSTYNYDYTMQFGGYREKKITVTSVSSSGPKPQDGVTTNTYDSRGNLIGQTITNPGQTRSRVLSYDNNGQIISKTEYVHAGSTSSFGSEDLFYIAGKQVAALGTGTLDMVQFANEFMPVTVGAGTTPGTYVINAGDTLASIAQNLYGDAQLWYLIADANNVSFGPTQVLPSTEVGRIYRIPTALTDHNNSTTFAPYNAGAIIGSSSPSPYLPPPPGSACGPVGSVIAAVVIVVVVAAVTYYTGGLATAALTSALSAEAGSAAAVVAGSIGAGIGAAAGNAAGQGVGNLLGVQHGFDVGAVASAGASATFGAFFAGGLAQSGVGFLQSGLARQAARSFGGYVGSGLFGNAGSGTGALYNFATQYATGALLDSQQSGKAPGFSLSNALAGIASGSLNPETGWVFNADSRDWAHIATSVLQPFAAQFGTWVGSKIPNPIASPRTAAAQPARGSRLSVTDVHASVFGAAGAGGAPGAAASVTRSSQTLQPDGYDPANLLTYSDQELRKLGYWREFVDGKPSGLLLFEGDDGQIHRVDPTGAGYTEGHAPDESTQWRIDQQRLGPIDEQLRAGETGNETDPPDPNALDPSGPFGLPISLFPKGRIGDRGNGGYAVEDAAPSKARPAITAVVRNSAGQQRLGMYPDTGLQVIGKSFAFTTVTNSPEMGVVIEKLIKAGYTDIHVSVGAHGVQDGFGKTDGTVDPDPEVLKHDLATIDQLRETFKGRANIHDYNLGDPERAAAFYEIHNAGGANTLPPETASLHSPCFGANCTPHGSAAYTDPFDAELERIGREGGGFEGEEPTKVWRTRPPLRPGADPLEEVPQNPFANEEATVNLRRPAASAAATETLTPEQRFKTAVYEKLSGVARSQGLILEPGAFTNVGGKLFTAARVGGTLLLLAQISEIKSVSDAVHLGEGLAISEGSSLLAKIVTGSSTISFAVPFLLDMEDDRGATWHRYDNAKGFLLQHFTKEEIAAGGHELEAQAVRLLYGTKPFEFQPRPQPLEGSPYGGATFGGNVDRGRPSVNQIYGPETLKYLQSLIRPSH
jgi:YD repeat-containing protein